MKPVSHIIQATLSTLLENVRSEIIKHFEGQLYGLYILQNPIGYVNEASSDTLEEIKSIDVQILGVDIITEDDADNPTATPVSEWSDIHSLLKVLRELETKAYYVPDDKGATVPQPATELEGQFLLVIDEKKSPVGVIHLTNDQLKDKALLQKQIKPKFQKLMSEHLDLEVTNIYVELFSANGAIPNQINGQIFFTTWEEDEQNKSTANLATFETTWVY